jgi:carbohydrate kinase (thermoresistant glucokinase family)
MSTSTPLSDEDRWLWLETIKATALIQLTKEKGANIIVTCSALKRVYREELRQSRVLKTVFVMLQGRRDILRSRVAEREGHFMGGEMVESQSESLEAPGVKETTSSPSMSPSQRRRWLLRS